MPDMIPGTTHTLLSLISTKISEDIIPILKLKKLIVRESKCKTIKWPGSPDSTVGKESACKAGDPSSIPGSETST